MERGRKEGWGKKQRRNRRERPDKANELLERTVYHRSLMTKLVATATFGHVHFLHSLLFFRSHITAALFAALLMRDRTHHRCNVYIVRRAIKNSTNWYCSAFRESQSPKGIGGASRSGDDHHRRCIFAGARIVRRRQEDALREYWHRLPCSSYRQVKHRNTEWRYSRSWYRFTPLSDRLIVDYN